MRDSVTRFADCTFGLPALTHEALGLVRCRPVCEIRVAILVEIVDDDEPVRDSLRALLECLGYQVDEYASGDVFLSNHSPESKCIIMDQQMPGLEGLDVVERLRTAGDQTPIIIITGRSDATIEARAQALGLRVLHKPVNDEELATNLEAHCRDSE